MGNTKELNHKIRYYLFSKNYTILLEDRGRTHNINCHTFDCLAMSEAEAIGKMTMQRPEFIGWKIQSITCY